MVASPLVAKNFFDFGSTTQLAGQVTLPPGTTTQETSQQLKRFETVAAADPSVKLVQVTVASSDYGGYSAGFETNQARLLLLVKDKRQATAVVSRLQQKLNELYGVGSGQLQIASFGPGSNRFEARASGQNDQALRQASDLIVAKLQQDSELSDVQSDLATAKPQLSVDVDPKKASAHGLSPLGVCRLVLAL